MDSWSDIAAHYHRFVDSPADKLRTEVLYPVLWEIMAPMAGQKVLDIGCGNGFFANQSAIQGAKVDAFDNAAMISIANQHFAHTEVKYLVHNANSPFPYPDQSYDSINANLVLMDMANVEVVLAESNRLLRPSGKILFSILHPCFTPPVGKFRRGIKGRVQKKWSYFHLNDYFHAPSPITKQSFGPQVPATHYYHRTISHYMHLFRKYNLVMIDMFEPEPSTAFIQKYPHFFHARKISIFSIFVLQKR